MPARILVVDDDRNICEVLRLYLEAEGYQLILAHDGSEALDCFREFHPALVLLDILLPTINGYEVCRMIRHQSDVPILMLTALDGTDNTVQGLDAGADDYIVKPFDPKEVAARVRAHLRRCLDPAVQTSQGSLKLFNLEVNLQEYRVTRAGEEVSLKPKEIQLLYFLMEHRNLVFTREQLLDSVWGFDFLGETRTVDVHINRLREKLKHPENAWAIKSIYGVGYKFEVENV